MTNLTPNDLSHLSDEAFEALCPQGEHAPGPEPLSPAAQKVLNAYIKGLATKRRDAIAAALRTAADQLINVKWSVEMWELHQDFHSIATELEALPND